MWRSLPGAGTLVVKDGLVLMVRHERSGRYRWELPSGLVDAGETFEQAAERETLEETGVAVSITTLLCVAVMEVSSAEYRGINLYYRAEALSAIIPLLSCWGMMRRQHKLRWSAGGIHMTKARAPATTVAFVDDYCAH
jgi:8-oxo-dGTP pyrophosphatase MutT (NUDIX family)